MFKQTIEYEDYNGIKCKEDFYFNLSKAELIRLQATYPGGFGEYLQKIINAGDTAAVYKEFEKIVRLAYGEKSGDGKHFRKKAADGHDLSDDFADTEAYSELLMMLLTDEEFAAKFVNGLMPAALVSELNQHGGIDRARKELGIVERASDAEA